MTSRLERLFVLLETGSSSVTRKAAAKQLGEVQRQHPHELHRLLARIATYLRSSAWETRIAAGQAVEAVVGSLPPWDPQGYDHTPEVKSEGTEHGATNTTQETETEPKIKTENDTDVSAKLSEDVNPKLLQDGDTNEEVAATNPLLLPPKEENNGVGSEVKMDCDSAEMQMLKAMANKSQEASKEQDETHLAGRMSFQKFDIGLVLANGKHLMGSEGSEYDVPEEVLDPIDLRAKMALQRQQLNARLGLDAAAKVGVDISDLFCTDDLKQSVTPSDQNVGKAEVGVVFARGLSCRERNRARRKARQAGARTREPGEPEPKRAHQEDVEDVAQDAVPDATGSWGDAVDWPLEGFCDRLAQDLFSASWETRHGAATGLREILRLAGRGAGKPGDASRDAAERAHQAWLHDLALRLLCVLALDRFGDFVADQVVAPVRETCAQALGTILRLMSPEGGEQVLQVLLQLVTQPEWEARHGGLLGIKYLLAVKQESVVLLLPRVFPPVLAGLGDDVDDVGAVAAAALLPAAPHLAPDQVTAAVARLWELLRDQDELAAACSSFLGLLAALLAHDGARMPEQSVSEVAPRLWPFLSHAASGVRRATLTALAALTSGGASWPAPALQEALRHLLQRALVEPLGEVQRLIEEVWTNLVTHSPLDVLLLAACPYVSTWLCLTMQPARTAIDPALLLTAKTCPKTGTRRNRAFSGPETPVEQQKQYLGGGDAIAPAGRDASVVQARCLAARMLGLLSCYVVQPSPGVEYEEPPADCYVQLLLVHLSSRSAVQRQVAALVLAEAARCGWLSSGCPAALTQRLHASLSEALYYDEIATAFTRLLQDSRDFVAMLRHRQVPINLDKYDKVLTLEQIQTLSGVETQLALARIKGKAAETLEERRKAIQSSATQASADQTSLNVATQAALAGATVLLKCLPEKLNPMIKPLMEAVKKEENQQLQSLAAEYLARLIDQCVERSPCPNAKIVANLSAFLRADPDFTPSILPSGGEGPSSDSGADSLGEGSRTGTPTCFADNYSGILTLANQQKTAERAMLKRANSTGGRGPGRPPNHDVPPPEEPVVDENAHKLLRTQRRGAASALTAIGAHFGAALPTRLPKLWDLAIEHLVRTVDPDAFDPSALMNGDTAADELITSLQVLEVTSPSLHLDLLPQVLTVTDRVCALLVHPYRAVRHLAARCVAALTALDTAQAMAVAVRRVLPMLATRHPAGAVEALACVTHRLQLRVVPFIVLLVVPLLGRMSDQELSVRLLSTQTFAALVQLMPLDGAVPEPPGLSAELRQRCQRERRFLAQLLNPASVEPYRVGVPVRATLRTYQQAGVNWLAFLNKYKLHGVLCDDMGLGKTLQSICMLAGDHHARSLQFMENRSPENAPLPSLVVCPPTLTGHWLYEVDKFVSRAHLSAMQYAGPPVERCKLRKKVRDHNLVIASYDIVRKDIDFFSSIKWNYCILDEGHIIKNGKTKASKAVKRLLAEHRLILSGTPIQNNVLELWSLFDFLMPGFLGSERQFSARYSRPILAARDPKSCPRDHEAGALAMEALHRQVLPFLLRRMKEDVLQDLPPKITQDYYCELSPLQRQLYEDFSRSRAHLALQTTLTDLAAVQGNTHVFQALRYLQNVCNSPKLALTPAHPEFQRVAAQLREQNSDLADIQHSAKLPALKQLLLDCGIGCGGEATNQHRALIFCQLKAMLDVVEVDLLRRHMPAVSFLRLDGSVPAAARHAVVARFNADPSIDVLLLTTQVGGLGLNLTGADTVIFVEHDWNPMKDLQAMDRAHRIGQKKVVNVYRLITRATLEEKIMGLQKFKLMTANTVISSENAGLETMATDQVLDLFSLTEQKKTTPQNASLKNVLETLPALWETDQYEHEYDLSTFVKGLAMQ